ncbi:MAG: cofactor assembly of complex C subunit B [Cyanobacteria bacterium J06626_14]
MPVLPSTFFLTLLLMIGLFFFIRASTKDRIEVAHLIAEQPQEPVLEQLQTYFTTRAYKIIHIDAAKNLVTFEGFVRPSVFLAIFLSSLAAAGMLCIALVLMIQFPNLSPFPFGLVILSPLAGVFYWKRSARPEKVALQVEPLASASEVKKTEVIVTAHRDEIIQLQRSLSLQREYIQ